MQLNTSIIFGLLYAHFSAASLIEKDGSDRFINSDSASNGPFPIKVSKSSTVDDLTKLQDNEDFFLDDASMCNIGYVEETQSTAPNQVLSHEKVQESNSFRNKPTYAPEDTGDGSLIEDLSEYDSDEEALEEYILQFADEINTEADIYDAMRDESNYTTKEIISATSRCIRDQETVFDCIPLFIRLISNYSEMTVPDQLLCDKYFDSSLITKLFVSMYDPSRVNVILDEGMVETILHKMKPASKRRLMYTEFLGLQSAKIEADPKLVAVFKTYSPNCVSSLLSATLNMRGSPRNWSQTGLFYKNLKLLWDHNKEALLDFAPHKNMQDRNYEFLKYFPYWKQLDSGILEFNAEATFSEEFILAIDLYLHLRKNCSPVDPLTFEKEQVLNENVAALLYNFVFVPLPPLKQRELTIDKAHVKIINILAVLGALNVAQVYFLWAGKNQLPFDERVISLAAEYNRVHGQHLRGLNTTSMIQYNAQKLWNCNDDKSISSRSRVISAIMKAKLKQPQPQQILGGTDQSAVDHYLHQQTGLKWDPSALAFFIRAAGDIPTIKEDPNFYSLLAPPHKYVMGMIRPWLNRAPLNPCLDSSKGESLVSAMPPLEFLNDEFMDNHRYEHEYTLLRIFALFSYAIPLTEPLVYRPPSKDVKKLPLKARLQTTFADIINQFCDKKAQYDAMIAASTMTDLMENFELEDGRYPSEMRSKSFSRTIKNDTEPDLIKAAEDDLPADFYNEEGPRSRSNALIGGRPLRFSN